MVDETIAIEKVMNACNFVEVNLGIDSKNFPIQKKAQKVEKEILIFGFNEIPSSNLIIDEMKKFNCNPANIWDIGWLALKEPKLQEEYSVAAFGSTYEDEKGIHIPYLFSYSGDRCIGLKYFGGPWFDDKHVFAGVRNGNIKEKNIIDREMLHLIEMIAQNFPEMSPDVIQGWVENPRALKYVLKEALTPPIELKKNN